jgi:hypothetical protein
MSRKAATRPTARKASSVKSPGGGRQAAIWTKPLYEKAVNEDTFIQVYIDDEEDLKRRPNNLKLTGAKNMWANPEKEDYVYEPVSRLAGPREAVEMALADFGGQIKKVTGDKSSAADLLKGAYAKGTKSKKYQQAISKAAKAKKEHLKATREAVQEGDFALADAEYIFNAFTEGKRGKRGTKTEKAEKAKKPRKTGLLFMLGKARAQSEKDEKGEGPYVVDVSDITATGTGARIIPLSRAQEDENLQTIQGVGDWIIYSSDPKKFNAAMRVLSEAGAKGYLKYQGKLGQTVSGDLASSYAARAKDELKSYRKATEEEEEEASEEEEAPKRKTTRRSTKKAPREEEEEEEEEETPKPTARKTGKGATKATAKTTARASRSKSRSRSRSASPSKKAGAASKPAARTSRSASPSKKATATKPKSRSASTSPRRAAAAVPEPEETSAGAAAGALRSKTAAKPGARRLPTRAKPAGRPATAAGSPGADEDEE